MQTTHCPGNAVALESHYLGKEEREDQCQNLKITRVLHKELSKSERKIVPIKKKQLQDNIAGDKPMTFQTCEIL